MLVFYELLLYNCQGIVKAQTAIVQIMHMRLEQPRARQQSYHNGVNLEKLPDERIFGKDEYGNQASSPRQENSISKMASIALDF